RLPEAEAGYRRVLANEQSHADAWQLLGLIAHQAGRHELAIDLITRAIRLDKDLVTYHTNLAVVLKAVGRREEALAAYAEAARLDPVSADIPFNRGLLLTELGRFVEAAACYRQAIALRGDHAATYANLGIALSAQQQLKEAVAAYDKALVLQPQAYGVHYNRAIALWQLNDLAGALAGYRAALAAKPDLAEARLRIGNILKQQERFDEAAAAYRDLLERVPAYAEAHCNLGLVLFAQGNLDGAEQAYRRALAEKPALCEAHVNLGNIYKEREQYEEAVSCYRTALGLEPDNLQVQCNLGAAFMAQDRLHEAMDIFNAVLMRDPSFAEAHYNRSIALTVLGDLPASIEAYDRAIALRPDHAKAHYNSSYPRLLLGDLERGFACYQWRVRGGSSRHVARYVDRPMLNDINVAGRTVLLHAEQGLGDAIQFSRYAAILGANGVRVVLELPRHLHRLFSSMDGIHALHAQGEAPPPFDFHCPLMSLPALFGTTVETIPASAAYLFAEEAASLRWRERLGNQGFKIGIAWQGNPNASAEKGRSAPLAAFAPLAALPGVRLISLQKTHGLDQLHTLPPGMQVETLGEDFDSGPDAFIDTAGVMMNLDLVVTVDTSIGHLAGALGRPTWIALQKIPHWVWMLERSDSPWYPSVRLFRQTGRGDWSGPFAAMAQEIQNTKG
ncbi:MAG TPA: tetratricopeptide repeat protein, partial [Burkholderiaceae bacterium]